MGERTERSITVVLTGAICLMAVAITKRVFVDRSDDGPSPSFSYEEQWKDLWAVGRPIGRRDAPIQIIEVADLQCPGCRGFQPILDAVLERYDGKVAVAFVHYPLEFHAESKSAHRGAECAIGGDRFAEFVRSVYSKQDSLPHRQLWEYAKDAGLSDSAAFQSCVSDTTATDAAITDAVRASDGMKITRTPTLIVNGWRFAGIPRESHLSSLIDDLLDGKTPNPDSNASK